VMLRGASLFLSCSCEGIYQAGSVHLTGYVGTKEQFLNETQGICQACVDDEFYDGVPQACSTTIEVW